MVDPARLTSLKLRRCVVVSAAILPSRLLLLVKLASSQVREIIVSPTKNHPLWGGSLLVGDCHPKGEATTILAHLTANSMRYKKNRYWSDLLSLCIHPFAHFFSGTTRPKKII